MQNSDLKQAFIQKLQDRVLVADGAMGTLLYAKGVYINKCYEQVNSENPNLVKDIHLEYLKAGAEIIETNTFGANSSRLKAFGLESHVEEFNKKGVEIARQAVEEFLKSSPGSEILIAGSAGPLSENSIPFGRLDKSETRSLFEPQMKALEEAGVDLFVLETFTHIPQLEAAVEAIRKYSDKPIVALMTIDDESQSALGENIEGIAHAFDRLDVQVVGFNCSSGPSTVLDAIEKLKALTKKPLAVIPNAGIPKNVYGRTMYMATPEYFGSFAKKFVSLGVRFIGGCCGTTPTHIRRAQDASLAIASSASKGGRVELLDLTSKNSVEPVAIEKRSRMARRLSEGKFVISVELDPPRGTNTDKVLANAKLCHEAGIDCINIADGPRASARMNPASLAVLFQTEIGIETIVHVCCRDRNLLGLQSDLMGANSLGLRNALCITGDPPKLGDYPEATSVFDVDAIGLTKIVHRLNRGMDLAGNSIGQPTAFFQGVGCNPANVNFELEMQRLQSKIEAGAEYVLTQPVYEEETFARFLDAFNKLGMKIPILIGICPLASLRNAQFLHTEVPGMQIPEAIMSRMSAVKTPEGQREEGISIAREALQAFRSDVQGTYIMPPFSKAEIALAVVQDFIESDLQEARS